jgi:hypothetical protein
MVQACETERDKLSNTVMAGRMERHITESDRTENMKAHIKLYAHRTKLLRSGFSSKVNSKIRNNLYILSLESNCTGEAHSHIRTISEGYIVLQYKFYRLA